MDDGIRPGGRCRLREEGSSWYFGGRDAQMKYGGSEVLRVVDGVGLVSVALGCFGIAEIAKNLDSREERTPFQGKIKLIPTWQEFKRIIPSALRGSAVGSVLGILPGGGPVIAQFAAYAVDKKLNMLYAVDSKGESWNVFQTRTMPTNILIEKGGKIVSIAAGCDPSGLLANKVSEKAAKTLGAPAVDVKTAVDAKKDKK